MAVFVVLQHPVYYECFPARALITYLGLYTDADKTHSVVPTF